MRGHPPKGVSSSSQTGCPSPGVLRGRDKPPWLAGRPLGLIKGPREAWTLLRRSGRSPVQAYPQGRLERGLH